MKTVGCIIVLAILTLNLILGVGCFKYTCKIVFGKEPPTSVCIVGGLLAGEVVIPGSFLLYLLAKSDVIHPPLVKP